MKILPLDFWVTFSAVMLANLLTVWLIYSLYMYTKREKGEDDTPWHVLYGGILIPFALLIGGFYLISAPK